MNALFLDDGGVLHAPAPTTTVLDGVTRRSVVQIARGAGIPVSEAPLQWPDPSADPEGLPGALLATGTASGLAVVDEVREENPQNDLRSWRSKFPNAVLSELQDLTRSCFHADSRPTWWVDTEELGGAPQRGNR